MCARRLGGRRAAAFRRRTLGAWSEVANRAGMRSVLLTQEGGHLPELDPEHPGARPDYVIGHLEEFVPAVLGRDWP